MDKFVIESIDDIFIYSNRNKEYEEHLRHILELLKNKELYANFSKIDITLGKANVVADALSKKERAKPLRKCMSDETLAIPLDEIQIDDKLHYIKEPIEIMDREVKRLKQSRIPIIKVRWNSRRGPEFAWEREDQMQKTYPHLFANPEPSSNATS
nr:putative reverse transcriptase domain-containing protein [Tanacetum cinerariifolium]